MLNLQYAYSMHIKNIISLPVTEPTVPHQKSSSYTPKTVQGYEILWVGVANSLIPHPVTGAAVNPP